MYRSRVLQACVALFALAIGGGIATAATTEPDDTSGGAPPPEDMDFQIDMMLGLVPEDEMQDYWAQQNMDTELGIQQCMNDAGFNYEPMSAQDMAFDQYNGLSQLEYAQQYGFGMWTTMDPENQQTGPMMEWPNQDIVDELSVEEQNAWFEVNNRCSEDAYSGANDPWSNPMVQQIMEDFNRDVENDPRFRDSVAAWQECMAGFGHPFASLEEMYGTVFGDMEDQGMSDLQSQFYESEAWLESSPDHAEWQALVDEEIEIAVADATCTPALNEARLEIQRDLRDDLVAVWQTIDWSLPPVTFEEVMFPEETVEAIPSDSGPGTTEPAGPDSGDDGPTETSDPAVGLDLGNPIETTEP